jgi:hypothetical protein
MKQQALISNSRIVALRVHFMPRVTQIAVTLQNKPGTLAQLCSTLRDAGVNISAVDGAVIAGRGKVRLLVDNPDKAKDALKAAKIRFSEEEAIAIELENRPGALGEVAGKLAQAKINIKYGYATTSEGSTKTTVILAVPDVAKALGVLGG